VLAKANRITSGADYRATVRRGRRSNGEHVVTYVRRVPDRADARFGFIVSKAVGGAVTRNRVRRRLKAACYELLPDVQPGVDVVVRALPASVHVTWTTLQGEISRAVDKVGAR
jgi:ribonuclease P protein component